MLSKLTMPTVVAESPSKNNFSTLSQNRSSIDLDGRSKTEGIHLFPKRNMLLQSLSYPSDLHGFLILQRYAGNYVILLRMI